MISNLIKRLQPLEGTTKRIHIVECNCLNPHHILVFGYDADYNYIGVYFASNYNASFFRRVLNALMYVFKKRMYGVSDEVLVTGNNLADLEEVITEMKNWYGKKENANTQAMGDELRGE